MSHPLHVVGATEYLPVGLTRAPPLLWAKPIMAVLEALFTSQQTSSDFFARMQIV